MTRHVLPAVDGVAVFNVDSHNLVGHQISVDADGTTTAGTLTIAARGRGGRPFEAIPDGAIDLATSESVLFAFAVAEYEVTLAGFTGTATEIVLTDTIVEI